MHRPNWRKLAAASRARAPASTIQELRTASFMTAYALANELTRRQVPTLQCGKRRYITSVTRLLERLDEQCDQADIG